MFPLPLLFFLFTLSLTFVTHDHLVSFNMNIYPKPCALAGVLCYVSCVFQWRNLASLSACSSGPASETRLEVRKDSLLAPCHVPLSNFAHPDDEGKPEYFSQLGRTKGWVFVCVLGEDCKMVLITKGFWVQCRWIGPFHFNKKLIRSRTDVTRLETHSYC